MLLRLFKSILLIFLSAIVSQVIANMDSVKISGSYYIIHNINLSGNKITKPRIIFRELTFSKSDSILKEDIQKILKRSKENLLNTSLFNFVTITYSSTDSTAIDINIDVKERWYTFPIPIFDIVERNFNTWWETKNLARAVYGFYLIRENFRGRKELLTIKAQFGYTEQYGFSYQIPYIDKKQKSGLGFSSYYYRNHEIAFNTNNNNVVYYKDPDNYIRKEMVSRVSYTNRRGLYNTHILNVMYNMADIADTVKSINADYFVNQQTHINYTSLSYFFKHDLRDSKVYPLHGYYFDFEAAKLGLGFIKGESIDITNLYTSFKKYWQISNRIYLASGVKGKYSFNPIQPYYIQRALGYSNYVRGYEYYVVDGSSYALAKLGLKYELVKPHVKKIPYLNAEKFDTFHYAFYLELFSDMAYVNNKTNYKTNSFTNSYIYGTGIGLDFVTYYDNVFRLEYSFNKRGEYGIFLHLYAPI